MTLWRMDFAVMLIMMKSLIAQTNYNPIFQPGSVLVMIRMIHSHQNQIISDIGVWMTQEVLKVPFIGESHDRVLIMEVIATTACGGGGSLHSRVAKIQGMA